MSESSTDAKLAAINAAGRTKASHKYRCAGRQPTGYASSGWPERLRSGSRVFRLSRTNAHSLREIS